MLRAAVLATAAVALPAASMAQGASERVAGVVTPTLGVQTDGQGNFMGTGGTQPASVTREQRGGTTVVTVTPTL